MIATFITNTEWMVEYTGKATLVGGPHRRVAKLEKQDVFSFSRVSVTLSPFTGKQNNLLKPELHSQANI